MDPHNPILLSAYRRPGPQILETEAVRRRRELAQRWIDRALQIAILGFTLPGAFLAGGNLGEAKWGFALLLAGQPFWLLATWRARHWGGHLVSWIYTGIWIRAVLNAF